MTRTLRALGAVTLSWLFSALVSLDTGAAAPVDTTSNTGNLVSAPVVAAPTNVAAAVSLNVVPLLTCSATVSWSISSPPPGTAFEVRRVVFGTSTVVAGPWPVSGSPYVDSPIPLTGGAGYEWQVRSVLSNGWTSAWVSAVAPNRLLCLL